jgi:hypothetical protein
LFDPTVYDNLKVVLEGAVYDQDLSGEIMVMDRSDQMDLARLRRQYRISYALADTTTGFKGPKPTASLHLTAEAADLAGEVLESQPLHQIGCIISIEFTLGRVRWTDLSGPSNRIQKVFQLLHEVWGGRPSIDLQVDSKVSSQDHDADDFSPSYFMLLAQLDFDRKVNEDQMDDLLVILDKTTETLKKWSRNLDSQGFLS